MAIFRSRFPLRHALVTFVLALAPFCVRGADTVSVRIDRQPLWEALNQFAEQSGFQLLYSMDDVVQAGRSRPIGDCRFADRCLAQLLDRKGLQYEYVNLGSRLISIQRALPATAVDFELALPAVTSSERSPSRLIRGTRVIWTATQLATRKSGMRSVRLARSDRLEMLPSRAAVAVARTEALDIESRISYAPCPAPEERHFEPLEPVCSARRAIVERQPDSACVQVAQSVSIPVRSFDGALPDPRRAVVALIPATRFRIISAAGPRAPPLAV